MLLFPLSYPLVALIDEAAFSKEADIWPHYHTNHNIGQANLLPAGPGFPLILLSAVLYCIASAPAKRDI